MAERPMLDELLELEAILWDLDGSTERSKKEVSCAILKKARDIFKYLKNPPNTSW
jgi:hypothetical protein